MGRVARALLCSSLACSIATAAGTPDADAVRQALALLHEDGAGPAACRERLAGLARGAADTLLEALAFPEAFVAENGPGLGNEARAILVDLLRERPEGEVVPLLHGILRRDLPFEAQRPLIEITGWLGDASSPEPLLELVARMPAERRQLRTIQRELESALAEILRRHPEAGLQLAVSAAKLELPLQCTAARALGAAGDCQGLAGLERLLGRSPELDRAALDALCELDPTDPDCLRDVLGLLAWHLASPDPGARLRAATAAGRHGGAGELEALLLLLEDPDGQVRAGARQALRRISGLDFGSAAGPWSAWQRRERQWYDARAAELLRLAAEDEPAQAYQALRELAGHPLYRRELASCMGPVVARRESDVAQAACCVLGRLGGPAAVAPLEALLADERPEVARAAASALAALGRG